jgi:hypothetical protein
MESIIIVDYLQLMTAGGNGKEEMVGKSHTISQET